MRRSFQPFAIRVFADELELSMNEPPELGARRFMIY
jgi:hypothetical protein